MQGSLTYHQSFLTICLDYVVHSFSLQFMHLAFCKDISPFKIENSIETVRTIVENFCVRFHLISDEYYRIAVIFRTLFADKYDFEIRRKDIYISN